MLSRVIRSKSTSAPPVWLVSETSVEDDELEEYQRKVQPEDEEKNIDYCTQT